PIKLLQQIAFNLAEAEEASARRLLDDKTHRLPGLLLADGQIGPELRRIARECAGHGFQADRGSPSRSVFVGLFAVEPRTRCGLDSRGPPALANALQSSAMTINNKIKTERVTRLPW